MAGRWVLFLPWIRAYGVKCGTLPSSTVLFSDPLNSFSPLPICASASLCFFFVAGPTHELGGVHPRRSAGGLVLPERELAVREEGYLGWHDAGSYCVLFTYSVVQQNLR